MHFKVEVDLLGKKDQVVKQTMTESFLLKLEPQ